MKITIPLPAVITPETIYRGLTKDEIFELIRELDIRVAETDFTLKLITYLIDSVRNDMTSKEYFKFVEEFKY